MAGRHDQAARRRAKRSARERGCWTYIPAEVLVSLGLDPDQPAPFYRTWPGPKRKSPSVIVQLYTEP